MPEKKEPSWEQKFEDKMKQVEVRLEEIGKKVEEKGEAFGKRVEEKAKEFEKKIDGKDHGHHLFWGFVLLAVGIIWLGNNLNWFYYDVPWIAVVMIAGGLYLVIRNWKGRDSSREEDTEKQ